MAGIDDLNLSAEGLASELGTLSQQVKDFANNIKKINDQVQQTTKATKQSEALFLILNRQAVVTGSSFNSLAKTVNNIKNRLDNAFASADGLTKGMNKFNSILLGVGQGFTDLRNTVYSLQRELGTTFASALRSGVRAFSNTIASFFSLSGPTVSFQETIDTINAFQREFGGLLTRGEALKIAQASKDLGVSAEVFLKAQRAFLVVGADITRTTFVTEFRNAGLTAAQALQFAANNANLVAIAGVKYADSLARAAANAQRIGVGLDRTEALADGIVGNFEGALERFSELRAMGVEVDFNRLAAVAGTGTPEEVVRELQGQLGGNKALLEELQRNRFLKVALEQDLGLNIAEITRLAAGEGAMATEKTEAEKPSGPIDRFLERIGTVLSGLGLLNVNIAANTVAQALNTAALLKLGTGQKLLPPGGTPGLLGPGPLRQLPPGGPAPKLLGPGGGGIAGLLAAGKMPPGSTGPLTGQVFPANPAFTNAIPKAEVISPAAGGAGMGMGTGLKIGAGFGAAAGLATGVGTLLSGGGWKKAIIMTIAPLLGGIIGGALGTALVAGLAATGVGAPIAAAIGPALVSTMSGVGAMLAGSLANNIADDMISPPGYGSRTLVTPSGNIALNNNDTVIAGTQLMSAGTLEMSKSAPSQQATTTNVNVDMSKLESKLDKLASAFSAIKIEMDGNTVGRVSLNARSPLDRLSVVG
jgi:hypothetical protein